MSIIEETDGSVPSEGPQALPSAASSFKARLAKKRRELEENVAFELKVPAYEDLWVRYRVMGFEEMRAIGMRIEAETDDQAAGERLTAAETLSESCVDLLECKGFGPDGKPIFESLGYRWTAAAARDLFDVQLPEGATDNVALANIFPYPRDMLMMNHFQEYLEQGMGYLPQIDALMTGESRAVSAPTTSVS